nr:MAG TPA: hypothetical protein [Caudoviricetes sp.]
MIRALPISLISGLKPNCQFSRRNAVSPEKSGIIDN